MKKSKIIEYIRKELENNTDYTFIVIDSRDWKKNKPEIFTAWKPSILRNTK